MCMQGERPGAMNSNMFVFMFTIPLGSVIPAVAEPMAVVIWENILLLPNQMFF